MTDPAPALERLISQVRRAFRELAAAAEGAWADLGLNAGDRAHLEHLAAAAGPRTLSALAREATVSRQHIQQGLRRLDPALLVMGEDPADRRAVTVTLSPAGWALWQRVRERDAQVLGRLAMGLDSEQLVAAAGVLEEVRARTRDLSAAGGLL